jgi:hypothetical protein
VGVEPIARVSSALAPTVGIKRPGLIREGQRKRPSVAVLPLLSLPPWWRPYLRFHIFPIRLNLKMQPWVIVNPVTWVETWVEMWVEGWSF